MQTFLPHPNFVASAAVLDRARLGQQRNEARQIISAIRNGGGWRNHPAVKMWRDHVPALELYHDCVIREWERRGYVNTQELRRPIPDDPEQRSAWGQNPDLTMPPWLGDPEFHASHRSQLLLKMPDWYGHFGWTEVPGLPYKWPV